MTSRGKRVMQEALALSDEERADLVACLLATLEPPAAPVGESADAWILELERRALAAEGGEPGLSWPEARALAERRIRNR